jgi:hypothetical protein
MVAASSDAQWLTAQRVYDHQPGCFVRAKRACPVHRAAADAPFISVLLFRTTWPRRRGSSGRIATVLSEITGRHLLAGTTT